MAINVSMLNRSIFPRIRSLTRGWVTPNNLAAWDCVSFRRTMSLSIELTKSARSKRLRASVGGKPMSSKTLPLDEVIVWSGIGGSLPCFLPPPDDFPKPPPRNFNVALRRFAAAFFECVKDINGLLIFGDINQAVSCLPVNANLEGPGLDRRHRLE